MKQILSGQIQYDGETINVVVGLSEDGNTYILKKNIQGLFVWESIPKK